MKGLRNLGQPLPAREDGLGFDGTLDSFRWRRLSVFLVSAVKPQADVFTRDLLHAERVLSAMAAAAAIGEVSLSK